MDKVQKHNSFNTNTPSSESYKNDYKYRHLFPKLELLLTTTATTTVIIMYLVLIVILLPLVPVQY